MNIANRIILSVINLFLITLVSACASHEDSAVDELLSRCSELDKAYTTSNADSVLREVASIEDGPLAKVRLDVKTFCLMLRARGAEFKGEQDSAIVKFDERAVELNKRQRALVADTIAQLLSNER